MINKNAIDTTALKYLHLLKEAGYSAYFVGGAVRDLLLGKTPKDFDIATNATPHQIKRVIPSGKIIGRRFRHVLLEKAGGRYEIVTFRGPVVEQEPNELETEGDPSTAEDSNKKRYPDLNQFGTAEQDATRRDFTINALFYDPDSDELVDYVGGKKDIDDRTVRTIGEATVRLKDDPIRILRAIRHKVKLGLEYNKELKDAIYKSAPNLETTSKDRIREEFFKVCIDRSIGDFLLEAHKMRVSEHITPWFKKFSEEQWEEAEKLWGTFTQVDQEKDLIPEVGISIMMVPLINDTIIRAYNEKPSHHRPEMVLPDIKFFLSSEEMRGWLLRILRVSKIQTDTVLRACFYWSRMTGKWLEEGGVPKKIEGRLHTQTGALIGAYISKVWLITNNKDVPTWIEELAVQLWENKSNKRQEFNKQERFQDRPQRSKDSRDKQERHHKEQGHTNYKKTEKNERFEKKFSNNNQQQEHKSVAQPILDKPLVWNGPLHAPVLRPIFYEDVSNLWQAYRPSGIPLPPIDKAILSSKVSNNYKPEFSGERSGSDYENEQNTSANQNDSEQIGRNSYRRNEREEQEPLDNQDDSDSDSSANYDEQDDHDSDSQENFDSLQNNDQSSPSDYYEDPDDNIGNRIDGPPTSGYNSHEANSANALSEHEMLTSHSRAAHNNQRRSNFKKNHRNNNNRSGKFRRNNRGGGGSHGHSNKSGNYKPST